MLVFTIRYRSVLWFAAGVAVTLALVWSLLAWGVCAAPGPGESTIVSVTPTRILDTRDPVNLGLAGPFVSAVSQKLQVTGSVATSGGSATVVPAGSTGVLLNVTVVGPTAAGFLSVRPGDASGAPSTSSLNFASGGNVPNAVQVSLPTSGATAGQIDITFDAYGQAGPATDVLIDVVGYTTNVGIQELAASVAANAAALLGKADASALAAKADASALAGKANVSQLPIAASTRENDGPVLDFDFYTAVVATTLTVPSAGLIQVWASTSVTGLPAASTMSCYLASGSGVTPAGDFANTGRSIELLASNGSGHCTTVGALSVAGPGTYTVKLVGRGADGIQTTGATINALFVPAGSLVATDEAVAAADSDVPAPVVVEEPVVEGG